MDLLPLKVSRPPSSPPRPVLSIGLPKKASPEKRRRNANFNEDGCGPLEESERCDKREKWANELYKSEIYRIFKGSNKIPVKIRKIRGGDNIRELFLKERGVYENLKKNFSSGFKRYCLPYIGSHEINHSIDFEYVSGETLQDFIHKKKIEKYEKRGRGNNVSIKNNSVKMSINERKYLLNQCMKCLIYLAEADYIHGDIKLDNFWYDTDTYSVRIFDFEKSTKRYTKSDILYDFDRLVNLIDIEDEFGFSQEEASILMGGSEDTLRDHIESGRSNEETFNRLVEVYKHVEAATEIKKGGGKRTRTRKNRSRK